MSKEYVKIDFPLGSTLEQAVEKLLSHRSHGELVCGEFNQVMLCSDTVTLDGAHIAITGMTKEEHDRRRQQWIEDCEKQEAEHQANIPNLQKEWSAKGREILTEDKWAYWDEIVPIRLNDLYRGMELGCCLDIVKILNSNGTLDEAKDEMIRQNHSGMSFGLVRAMVKEFCSRGSEFADYVV